MTRDVSKVEVVRTNKLHGRTLEHCVMLLAYETRILYSFMDHVTNIGVGTDNTDIVFMCFEGVQGNICYRRFSVQKHTGVEPATIHARCPIRKRIPMRLM